MVEIYISGRHRACVTSPGDIASVPVHGLQRVVTNGRQLVTFPHDEPNARILRANDITVPTPILRHYDWGNGTPWATQKITAALLTLAPRAYVLSTMGTGKTRAALWAADWLLHTEQIHGILVICTLSTISPVWEREIVMNNFKRIRHQSIYHRDRGQRLKRLANTDKNLWILNHDGVSVLVDELAADRRIDAVIIDEIGHFRNQGTQKWRALKDIVDGRKYVWGMTGTPMPAAPTDVWAQTKLITPDTTPRYFTDFRDKTMTKVTEYMWKPKKGAIDKCYALLKPSVRYTRDDIMELPPCQTVPRECELSTAQAKHFKELMVKFATEAAGVRVKAVNDGVKISKLLQVIHGFLYTKDGGAISLPTKPRLDLLDEVIEEAGDNKMIIFTPFTEGVHQIMEHLNKKQPKPSSAMIYGAVTKRQRDNIFSRFSNGMSLKRIVAHPKTMAHGLDLTAGNIIVWFLPIHSLELYEQANGRITRPGQTKKQLIIQFTATPLERMLYKRLDDRARLQGLLLDMLKTAPV